MRAGNNLTRSAQPTACDSHGMMSVRRMETQFANCDGQRRNVRLLTFGCDPSGSGNVLCGFLFPTCNPDN